MLVLTGSLKHYDWGSRDALPRLTGRAPAERPEAELWFGAHVDGPARVQAALDAEPTFAAADLASAIASDPPRWLGAAVARRFGARLPFLVKLLAAERPLSLQAHPSAAQAAAGFAREEAAAVPRTARERCYRDASHKPELVIALGPFDALAGFRAVTETASWLAQLGSGGAPSLVELRAPLAASADGAGLRAALTWAFGLDEGRRRQVVEELGAAARRVPAGAPLARAARWIALLAGRHPGDPGVVGAALLEQRALGPGSALFLPAGSLHAYLAGLAVEVMASSDNVLRGGLTTKHIDVPELLGVLDFDAPAPPLLSPSPAVGPGALPGEVEWRTSAAEFQVSRLALRGELEHSASGPELWVPVAGELTLTSPGGAASRVAPGEGAFVAPGHRLRATGSATVFRARVPDA
ncbi:MAG: mannose-6-phosphate isomerase, class I [Polyangiaceae bacterium]|nr:mannose-6-phosphate isomerase, class I [Polyangiaceae bacterium]